MVPMTTDIGRWPAERTVDAMLDLYHRTSVDSAVVIMRERTMVSKEADGSVYFSTHLEGGQADGYGIAVVHVRVPAHLAELDDEFPSGEQHYRIDARRLRPEHFIGWTTSV